MSAANFFPADKLDSVQVLRAAAAVAVVTHHIRLFGNGAWGVDLFFVISGFIMCFVTQQSGRHFFTKRVIRVVPLYWVGTLGIFCLALALPGFLKETQPDLMQLLKSLFFIPYQNGDNVFPIMFLGWTLNYEMFFYLVFALSMAISHAHRALICSAILVALAIIGRLVTFESVVLEFYTASILVEFAFGMFCYQVYSMSAEWRARRLSNSRRIVLTVLGVALIACMPLTSHLVDEVGRPLAWGVLALAAFLLVVHGLAGKRLPRLAVLIGDASYSLYLFHPYVLNVFNRLFHPYDPPGPRAYAMALVAIALCCAVAITFYRVLELPLTTRLRAVFLPRRKSGGETLAVDASVT